MKKICVCLFAFLFLIPQLAFSDELINLPAQESLTQPTVTSTATTTASPVDAKPSRGGIGLGRDKDWRLKPGFEFKTTYDSNVNREPNRSRNEDIIFNYTPSVELERKGTRFEVATGYQMNFQEFLRDSDQNSFNHIAFNRMKFTGEKLSASVVDNFGLVKAYASSEQSERRTIITNDARPEIAYRLSPKFSVSAVYRNLLYNYQESALRANSYILNDYGGRMYYHATSKLDFYVHGSGTDINYHRSGIYDSNGFSILAGSKGKVTNKVGINLETGYRQHNYDDSSINSFNDWVLRGIILYRVTSKTKATLTAKREKEESVYRNVAFYQAQMIGLGLSHRISEHIGLVLGGSFGTNRYPRETTEVGLTKKRRDYVYEGGAKVNWKPILDLIFSVGYNWRQRLSNFDNVFDYISHSVDASVSYKFS